MIFLRQSTASQEIPLGRFVDSLDGDTEETALTIANTDIKLWKTGATSMVSKNSGGATHMANGLYSAVLDATDSNTIGPMAVHVHVSGALAVKVECCVLAAAVFDVLFGTVAISTLSSTDLAGADDAVLAAIAALNNLSSSGAQAAAAAALTAYTVATSAQVAAVQTAVLAKLPSALTTNGNLKAAIKEIVDTVIDGDGNATPWGPA